MRERCGLDVGWNKTAAVWGAIDRSVDVAYLYTEHYRGRAEPSIHATAIKARGDWIPGVIDPASRGRGYLSRYTHRVAIANSRLIALDDRGVSFTWKDYRAKERDRHKTMTLMDKL